MRQVANNLSCLLGGLALLLWLFALPTFAAAQPNEPQVSAFSQQLVDAALYRTTQNVRYDGRYIAIPYPNGDVPADIGVCTDVIVRSYRALGIDLQQRVHQDMAKHFNAYPSKRIWGLTRPDRNIDHRRVPNLQAYFTRHGEVLPVSDQGDDYQVGDIVTWMLPGNLPHIGILVPPPEGQGQSGAPWVVHNIGAGPMREDMLFSYPITGRYRYQPVK
ncbi:DUF1287 domain-containing protein [Motilimonas sp. KMU-193]|uniref:DUF1287 domain-containing protein n=1 Tax=Motilimonas sp. KMU-193 TaxID=3388668 RepID=UPI00396B1BB2